MEENKKSEIESDTSDIIIQRHIAYSMIAGAIFAKVGAGAVKALLRVGTWLGIRFQVILAGASTYVLGYLCDNHFSSKENLFDFDLESMRKKYDEYVEKGKTIAQNLYKEQKSADSLDTIEILPALSKTSVVYAKLAARRITFGSQRLRTSPLHYNANLTLNKNIIESLVSKREIN